jgi:hypothetical protein
MNIAHNRRGRGRGWSTRVDGYWLRLGGAGAFADPPCSDRVDIAWVSCGLLIHGFKSPRPAVALSTGLPEDRRASDGRPALISLPVWLDRPVFVTTCLDRSASDSRFFSTSAGE